jgi:hypothetical protein
LNYCSIFEQEKIIRENKDYLDILRRCVPLFKKLKFQIRSGSYLIIPFKFRSFKPATNLQHIWVCDYIGSRTIKDRYITRRITGFKRYQGVYESGINRLF